MNKLKCFFILLSMSFSAFADPMPEIMTLVPADRMDFNSITREAPNVDCTDPSQEDPGLLQLNISRLDLTIRNVLKNREQEIEVNGQRYIPVMGPEYKEDKPNISIFENDDAAVGLSTKGLRFHVHNIQGKFDGKKIKFTIPLP